MRQRWAVVWVAGLAAAAAVSAQEDPLQRLIELADTASRAGNLAQAADLYREAVRTADASGDSRLPKALSGLADANDELGRYAEAEREYRRALSLAEAKHGRKSPVYAAIAVNLGAHFIETGEGAKGEGILRESIGVLAGMLPPNDAHLAMARNCLALVAMFSRRYDEAEKLYGQVIEALRNNPNPVAAPLAVTLTNLGALRRLQGRYDEATHLFAESIASIEAGLGDDHPLLVRALNNMAMAEMLSGHADAAEADFRRALAVAEKRLGVENPLYGKVLMNYAEAERKCGDKKAAKAMAARAKALLAENARVNGSGMTVDAAGFRAR
jgi:tetratricopeptide (TPR) repeat protein